MERQERHDIPPGYLLWKARSHQYDEMEEALKKGVDLNMLGGILLNTLAHEENARAVALLLKYGADPTYLDEATVKYVTAFPNNPELIQIANLLRQHGGMNL